MKAGPFDSGVYEKEMSNLSAFFKTIIRRSEFSFLFLGNLACGPHVKCLVKMTSYQRFYQTDAGNLNVLSGPRGDLAGVSLESTETFIAIRRKNSVILFPKNDREQMQFK